MFQTLKTGIYSLGAVKGTVRNLYNSLHTGRAIVTILMSYNFSLNQCIYIIFLKTVSFTFVCQHFSHVWFYVSLYSILLFFLYTSIKLCFVIVLPNVLPVKLAIYESYNTPHKKTLEKPHLTALNKSYDIKELLYP